MAWYEFWKRDTDDPLMRAFADKYKLHLLPIPRDDIAVCDVYIHDKNGMSAPGSIVDLLEPAYVIPPAKTGTMADVAGKLSKSVSLEVGVGLLEAFLQGFGVGGIIQKVRVGYENKGAHYMKFRFTNIQHESVSPIGAAKNLIDHVIPENHPFFDANNRYYLVTALARTSSITIIAEDSNHHDIDVELKALGLAEISPKATIEKSGQSEITFRGGQDNNSLVFGVELHELNYDAEKRLFKMNAVNKFVEVRGHGRDKDIRRPALIGDPMKGPLFLPFEIV